MVAPIPQTVSRQEIRNPRKHVESDGSSPAAREPEPLAPVYRRFAQLQQEQEKHQPHKAVQHHPFGSESESEEHQAEEEPFPLAPGVFVVSVETVEHGYNEEQDEALARTVPALDEVHELKGEQESSDESGAGGLEHALGEQMNEQYSGGGENDIGEAPAKGVVPQWAYAGGYDYLAPGRGGPAR